MRLGSEKGAEVGVAVFWGDPMSLDWERDGDALARRRPPPPLLLPAPPCDAAAEAEEARGGFDDDGIVRERAEDSSWLDVGCCAPCDGEKGDEVDDSEMDEAREPVVRVVLCNEEEAARDGLLVAVRCRLLVLVLVLVVEEVEELLLKAVLMGARRWR
jgi:hypothetical protein